MQNPSEAFNELYVWTMGREGFILQHVVDASGAQNATEDTPSIRVVFSLVGLYLRVERRFSGGEVQAVHRKLARGKGKWPAIALPVLRGTITAADVMAYASAAEREQAIDLWCESVWGAYRESHQVISDLLREHRVIS